MLDAHWPTLFSFGGGSEQFKLFVLFGGDMPRGGAT